MYPRPNDHPARGQSAERYQNERAYRREDDRRVELLGRRRVRVTGPLGTELAGALLPPRITGTCEREDTLTLMAGDLGDDVGRRAEAVQAEARSIAREPQRSKADQPCTQERRRRDVVIGLRRCMAEPLVGDDVLGIAAVAVEAGELRVIAEVLAARAAVAALAVGPAEPGNTDPLPAPFYPTYDLMPEHERQLRVGQLAVDDMKVRAADSAGADADEQLARAGLGHREIQLLERPPGLSEHHRAHQRGLTALSQACGSRRRAVASASRRAFGVSGP